MYSVRTRLLIALVLGFAVLIVGGGLYVSNAVEAGATRNFDASLEAKARALAALTEQDEGQIELDYRPRFLPAFERAERPEYYQFWLRDGPSLRRSTHLSHDLPRSKQLDAPRFRDLTLPDGRAGRSVELHYTPAGSDDDDDEDHRAQSAVEVPLHMVLVVARGRDRLDAMLAGVRWAIFGGGALTILLGALLVWRALARGLAPLDQIAAQVRELDAETLSARIELPQKPAELAPIVDQLNALLDRLDESFDRERRFAGNVAHELRTPLAELRALANVGAKWPDDREAVVAYFGDVDDIAGRMERVIADLLLLSRCHAGVERALCVPTDVRPLVLAAWEPLAGEAAARALSADLSVEPGFVVDTDPGKLALVLSNLLGNAVSYARPGSTIDCRGRIGERDFEITVRNLAEAMTDEDLKRLTEPFWRKDEARTQDGHAGLGLSLVAALAELLQMRVAFEQTDGSFVVRLTGPVRRPGPYEAPRRWVRRRHPQLALSDPQPGLRLTQTIGSEGDLS